MRRILLAGLWPIALAAAGPALAGAPVVNWSGVYVGAHAGYGWGTMNHTDLGFMGDGALAGGQVGINRQIGNLVFGIEGELSWAGLRGSLAMQNYFGVADVDFSSRLDWLGAVVGRIGIGQGASLVYLRGGPVWAGLDHGARLVYTGPAPAPFDFIDRSGGATQLGWTLGGGIEHAVAPNWSARIEYAYVGLAERTVAIAGTISNAGVIAPSATDLRVMQGLHLVKLGVNYHFGGPPTQPATAPLPAAGFDWSGFYLGLHAGAGAGRASWLDLDPRRHLDLAGGHAGGQAGLNLQVGRIVFGAEFEATWSAIGREASFAAMEAGLGATTLTLATEPQWLGIAAGRFGVAHDRWLVFAKLGAAVGHQRHGRDQVAPGVLALRTAGRHHHAGVLVGAGFEYALTPAWSVKGEYGFVDFGRESITTTGSADGLLNGNVINDQTVRQQLHLGKIGINYRFAPP